MINIKLAIISLKGESSTKILEESKSFFNKVDNLDIRKIEVHATSKSLDVLYEGKPLEQYDCIYIRGSYKYTLLKRAITEALNDISYIPMQPYSYTVGHDKLLTLLTLQKKGIPIPTTYLAVKIESAKKLLNKLNYPVIMKLTSGTQGKGVMFADSQQSAKTILDTLDVLKQPLIIQEYIETNATDTRAIVVGDKVIAAMKRRATKEEIRANIHAGGIGEKYELSYDTEQIAIKAAKAVKAEICAVDLLENKKSVVIEVNLSPGLNEITKVTKINVAKIIAEYLYEKTKEFKKQKKQAEYSSMMEDIEITSKSKGTKEIITNLDIKSGMIKLPPLITKLTEFNSHEDVIMEVKKGQLIIKKHKL